MNKYIVIVFLISLVSCELDFNTLVYKKFQKFIKDYGKKYESMDEFLLRYEIFKNNIIDISKKNNLTYEIGINKFTDLTKEEFSKKYLTFKRPYGLRNLKMEPIMDNEINSLPSELDWRDEGRVTSVKDQDPCGACWSFGTIANLEGLYKAKKGILKSFSEQMLIDCFTKQDPCNGGGGESPNDAISWIESNGIMEESAYPYAKKKQTCKKDPNLYVNLKVKGYNSLTYFSPVDEDKIADFLYKHGPLIVALNANTLQHYTGGILESSDTECDPNSLNHVVTLIGYGNQNGKDFWIVKNSWGEAFGEKGYFRIRKGKGTCGINRLVSTAILKSKILIFGQYLWIKYLIILCLLMF